MAASRRKLTDLELKAARPRLDEVRSQPRLPVYALLEDVRSLYNVGSMFRTADALHLAGLYLCGYTGFPPRREITKTALGAEHTVPWEKHADAATLARSLQARGMQLLVLEQTDDAVDFWEAPVRFPACFVVGNEVTGISQELVEQADLCLQLPMAGVKQSLNVATAFGVLGYELARRWNLDKTSDQ
ncbi:MAG: TrmH family RNA methyltransferase [Candidatus Marinimicrobia bacterium]|nr:TrmH family RNA methyltransferase [Candidatus Neomarinimicrobiota bacterium]